MSNRALPAASKKVRKTGTSRTVAVFSKMVNKRWFDARLEERHISQRGLAKLMGMDASAVSLMLSGKRRMSAAEASDVARLLGVHVEEVLRHAGIAVPVNAEKTVPIVGWVDERNNVRLGRPRGPQTTVAPPDVGEGCQALRVQSGVGTPMDGWLLFYRPSDGVSLEAVGRICVAKVADDNGAGALVLKRLERGYESGWHVLHGLGLRGGEPQHVMLESASPILWMKQ